MKTTIIFPIRISLREAFWPHHEKILRQFLEMSFEFSSEFLLRPVTAKPSIVGKISTAQKNSFRKLYRNTGWIKRWTAAWCYLIFEADFPLQPTEELERMLRERKRRHESEDIRTEIAFRRISYRVAEIIFDLSVSANIASLGCIRFDEGALITPTHAYPITSPVSDCEGAREYAEQIQWPPISEVGIKDFFDWYRKLNGTTKGSSDSPLGRAVCSFTYLFHPDFSRKALTDLVWSLSGIEALLGEGDLSRRMITEKLLVISLPKSRKKNKQSDAKLKMFMTSGHECFTGIETSVRNELRTMTTTSFRQKNM